MSVAICILNFNGSNDTIECLESIKKNDPNFDGCIYVLDNGSEAKDYKNLESGLMSLFPGFHTVEIKEENDVFDAKDTNLYLFKSSENYGFARGNNILMRIAIKSGYEFVLLQNNDTVLLNDSISKLVDFAKLHSDCAVATTDIRYFDKKDETWNAGGYIFAGTRKYNKNKEIVRAKSKGLNFLRVTYITGCFMLIRVDVLHKIGLLSNKFFFGEEDYDFSMRLKSMGFKQYCIIDTYILHKLGKSSERVSSSVSYSRKYVHRLNRMIDMRQHYNIIIWHLWAFTTFVYLFIRLNFKENIKGDKSVRYLVKLYTMSLKYDSVDKDLFLYLYNQSNNYFVIKR